MKVPDTMGNSRKCICGECPSYNACMQNNIESLYCAREKSSCEINRQGCICGECPLASEFILSELYYCNI